MNVKSMLGSHMASATGICSANAEDIVWKSMYEKLSPRPIPSESPMPPFFFLEESETPMTVRMNDANDMAMRLWYSISKPFMFAMPLAFCLSM